MSIRVCVVVGAAVALAACSSSGRDAYEPVIDLKASKNPGEAQMDWMGCEWLVKKYGLENDATTKCLEGRGHSVIGVAKK